ncbi:hypothetical protein CTAYLR_005620 [Chrysophaeum taylorii]|uniref:Uncharacterized protein n=1 Tax=Chrysophaeum taylorii TaxID=2483200 RepID=A0AAD7U9H0_9STRA|nr:hypothetical protein CTAYLR_005620 [Chrysophaeum taylorii]
MAETFAALDEKAAKGMSTGADKTAAVEASWARIRSDRDPIDFAAFVVEGKHYVLSHEGTGIEGLLDGMSEDCVYFCGLRRGDEFYRLLYAGANVGIIKKNKAQMQKNAPFNAMPGASADIELPARDSATLLALLEGAP